MARTSGRVLHRCCTGSQPNSASLAGLNGLTQASRRQNGAEKRRRSYSTSPS